MGGWDPGRAIAPDVLAGFPAERIERAGGPPHSPCAESRLSIAMAKHLPGPGTYATGDDWMVTKELRRRFVVQGRPGGPVPRRRSIADSPRR